MYRLNDRITIAILWAAVFAAYGNVLLTGVFQFDDYNVIVNNHAVHSWQAWWADFGHGIRPLLKLSYTLDWTLGWGAPGFHLTNLLIHGGNTMLVWLLTRHLVRSQDVPEGQVQWISLITALLFAVHPVHSEAVSYISGRSSALMTLFYLGGMLAYLLGRSTGKRFYLHGLTPLLFLAALAVKEMAVTFPLALWLLDRLTGLGWRQSLSRTWSSCALLIGALLVFVNNGNYEAHITRSLAVNDGLPNLITQVNALAYLLGQWLCPLWLNIDPDLTRSSSLSLPSLVLCAVLAIVVGIIMRNSNRHPWLKFALGWLLIQHFLVYVLLPRIDMANERQLYILSWPLLLATVAGLASVLEPRKLALAACLLATVACSLTVSRNLDFRSEVALWQATAKLSPHKARVHNNLGYAYFLAGHSAEARRQYLKAIALDADNYQAQYNLQLLDEKQAGRMK